MSTSQEGRSGAGWRKLGPASLVDFCMPVGRGASDQVQQSRLVIRVTLMTLGVCLLMDLKYVGEGAHALASMTTASVLLQIVALVLHKSTGSHRLGAHCFCFALWALFFGIATLSGGINSPNLVANAFLVVVSPMLLGRREGLLWLAAALVTALSQLVMTQRGLVGQTLPQEDLQATRLSEYLATFATVALTAFFYRRGQDLQRLAEYGRQLAGRLEKGPLNVATIDNGLRAHAELAEFWNVLVHVVRNAVDHGIEPVEVRRQLGKGEGHIELRAAITDGRLVVEVADDGRGIDWQRVRERAVALGMKAESRQDLISALFADGFSTKSEVSDISGRGVGLSSVLHVCASSSIEIQADSQSNLGTTFRFIFPDDALVPSPVQSTSQAWHRAAHSSMQ